ncbi:MAG: hypothetical protein CL463_00815 [Acidimicrobiaceae bacterium]|nr:hypothetical protein [Acidimicrobiaceae bacterium]
MKWHLIRSPETVSVAEMRDLGIRDLASLSYPHVLLENLETPELSEEKLHHLKKVLRIKPNSLITATDGKGAWGVFNFSGNFLKNVDEIRFEEERRHSLTIAISLTKSGKPDLAVQKLTEIGIDKIVLFPAEHSVPLWDQSKQLKNEQRLQRVTHSALEQSKGIWLPQVTFVSSFVDVAALSGVAMADASGVQITESCTCLAIGPEGGWSQSEYAFNLPKVCLSDQVLRAETAAIVAGAMMESFRTTGSRS